ncbi:hypothetical protein NDU88_009693 [Pleurodeles waltl]|uniref:Uncharacterized protein n=1 Tax=Pleurodeles waltl TaxID=8319 RepID=A0AAV7RZ24_PLEWA|nr:hypothetical protein NDU88_009693 [Pleurodeles waltl]
MTGASAIPFTLQGSRTRVDIPATAAAIPTRMRLGVFRLPGYIVYDRRVRDSLYSSGIMDPGRYTGYGSSNTK